MRDAEADLCNAEVEQWALMQHAGHGAADWVARLAAGGQVTVLCGPGHNGGDGYVAAAALKARGVPVRVVAPISPKTDLARHAAARFEGEVLADAEGVFGTVFVDAMFGIGLSRPLSDEHSDLIHALHCAHERSIAFDVPSGIDADTGVGPENLPAYDLTLAFGAWKPAHFTGSALCAIGTARLVDIGVPNQRGDQHLSLPLPIAAPGFAAHKYTRGLVTIVGGAMPGASLMSARAAAMTGAGYVKWSSTHDHPGRLPDLVRDDAPLVDALQDKRISAVVVGPGLGRDDEARGRLKAALACNHPLVIDADALHLLGPDMLAGRTALTILTPHEGELAHLCAAFGVAKGAKRPRAVALSKSSGCAVLAKGPDTLLAVGEQVRFFPPGSRWLSVAGSGDVLAGIAAARLAVTGDAMQAACEAVHLHSRAARIAGKGFTATMLAEAVHRAMGEML